jgi:uncharacterized membrane protein
MDDPLPAATPQPSSGFGASPGPAAPPPAGWAVAAGRGAAWWSEGWRLFLGSPGIWLVITILYLAIMIGLSLVPVIGQIASMLLHPAMSAGLILGCRALDRGGELTVSHLFAGFSDKLGPLVILALLYLAGWIVIAAVAFVLLIAVIGVGSIGALLTGSGIEASLSLLSAFGLGALLALLVAALFAIPLLMAFWFAPALIVLRGDEPFAAMKTSFDACLRNIPPFLIYGLLGVLFAMLASIPLGLGWFVLAPVYAATVYASYKDIFGVPA